MAIVADTEILEIESKTFFQKEFQITISYTPYSSSLRFSLSNFKQEFLVHTSNLFFHAFLYYQNF